MVFERNGRQTPGEELPIDKRGSSKANVYYKGTACPILGRHQSIDNPVSLMGPIGYEILTSLAQDINAFTLEKQADISVSWSPPECIPAQAEHFDLWPEH